MSAWSGDDRREVRPDVAVIVPTFRRPDLLRRCLASVESVAASSAALVEIVVVEDGAHPESCALVEREHPGARVVPLVPNQGYPAAVNAGVRASRAPWLVTINNDATLLPGSIDETLRVGASAPDVGSVALQQRFTSDPGTLYSAGLMLDARGHNADRLMGRPVAASEDRPIEVFGACGAAAAYRRAALHAIGGFDERFRFGLEDADVAWRLWATGWRCLYAPDAVVHHDLGGTIRHGSSFRLRQAGRNRVLLLAKNMGSRQVLRHAGSILGFDLAYVTYAAARLRTLAPLVGRLEGLRLVPAVRRERPHARPPIALSPPTPWREILLRRGSWRLGARAGR